MVTVPTAIMPKYKVRHAYLIPFSILLAFASSIQVGYIVSENGQVGFVLAEKLDWE